MLSRIRKLPLRIVALSTGILMISVISVSSMIAAMRNVVFVLENGTLIAAGPTYSTTVGAVLRQKDIELGEGDAANYDLEDRVYNNMMIRISRGVPVSVTVMGETTRHFTSKSTPVEILAELGFDMSGDYIIYPWAYEPIDLPAEITLIRTSVEYVQEVAEVPYIIHDWENHTLPVGEYRFIWGGTTGLADTTARVYFHDGVEVDRAVVNQEFIVEPDPAIREIGTLGRPLTSTLFLNTPKAQGFTYSRSFTAEATAYDPSLTAPRTPITATGQVARRGLVATDPRVIPMGTRMYITCPNGTWSYGFAVAADTGGAIRGYKVDLFMCTRAEAIQFGRRQVKVYILD